MLRNYLVSRLSEASTWRGLALLVAALGVHVAPDLQESIITTGIAVAGLVGVVTKG